MTNELQDFTARIPGERVLKRIAWLTLSLGFGAALTAFFLRRPDWAEGLAGGAVLGWLNFRWLSRGIRALMNAALLRARAHAGQNEAPASAAKAGGGSLAYLTLVFRYALVAVGVYVIFSYLHAPLISIGLGLCALVAAIMAASVWEVLKPES